MARVAYFDCFSGASGDMLVASLLDAGASIEDLQHALSALPLGGYETLTNPASQKGITGRRFHVRIDDSDKVHRHLRDIEALLDGADNRLSTKARQRALAVFQRLARAEGKVHGIPPDEVHFHEVGAVDSIVDIVGFAIALELAQVERVYASPLPLGHGFVRAAHGVLPLPAPATLEILAEAHAPTRAVDVAGETVTPTGAALLTELAQFDHPNMRVTAAGYGFGTRDDFPWPNAVRVWVGEEMDTVRGEDQVVLLECNLDDATGETLGHAMDRFFAAGALDVWYTPIQMKKNRPGITVSILSRPDQAEDLASALLRETPTLGLRWQELSRRTADRREEIVRTEWGDIRVKIKLLGGQVAAKSPEYEDCARIARERGITLEEVVRMAIVRLGAQAD